MKASAITAVIPLFDKAGHVADSLESVIGQTRPPARIIVVDDGSTDGGDRIVEQLGRPDVLLLRQPNAGPGAARNRGLALAQTSHVAFLDADDLWLPDHLEGLEALVAAHPGLPLYANRLGAFGEPAGPAASVGAIADYAAAWLGGLVVSTCAALVDREAALAVGGFGCEANRGEDLQLWLKLTMDSAMAIGGRVGAVYRREASALTRRPAAGPDAAMLWIEGRLADGGLPPDRARTLAAFRARLAMLHAADWIRSGGRAEARAFLAMAADAADAAMLRNLRLLAGPLWPLRGPIIGLRRLLTNGPRP